MPGDSMTRRKQGEMLAARFRLVRPLGSGGLGEVWLAEDVREGRERALKLLADEHARHPAHIDRFRREFSVAQSLVHPAIVRPDEFLSDGNSHFFTMPMLPGGHVGERSGEPWSAAARRLLPVCDALAYAHRKGVVHGDIKPQNILLDESGAGCLTDFGAAMLPDAADSGRSRRSGGSLAYMSPQRLEGRPARVSDDMYGLGCVVYELLCGFPPFAPDISEEAIRSAELAPPAAPAGQPQLPDELAELVGAMLARDEESRPVTMQAVRTALDEILADSATTEAPSQAAAIVARARAGAHADDGAPPPALQRSSGVPVWVAYALGGLLLAAAAVLFFVLPRFAEERASRRPPPERIVQQAEAPRQDMQLLRMQRDAADAAMGDMLQDRNYLAALQPSLWSGGAWEQAIAEEEKGDDFYRRREYPDAQGAYGKAGAMLRELREQAPDIGRGALEEALQAIESGDQAAALTELEKAGILLGATDPEVQSASRRAARVPETMQAVAEARASVREGGLEEQRTAWQAVLRIDPERQSARRELSAVNARIDRQLFNSRMSRGHAALGEGDVEAARTAFEAAAKQRPNDPGPVEALAALELEERGQRLAQLQAAAMAGRFAEDWPRAAVNYRGMLEIDSNIVAAQRGLAESERRARLDDALENTISNARSLNRDDAWQDGKRLLDEAAAIPDRGSRLAGQIGRLEQALTVAATPAPVWLRSDGLTEVTIFHVGRLGSFDSRMLELRPGAYTAVGTRDGYRDVRREFIVAPEGLPEPLVLICTDPI
ncbi:MAG: serine/threonine-protein kinase [Gammaproteobacteria bacterium]|nr:serine/threonine-protein kinase [Gammaproteobacteria bacterium]